MNPTILAAALAGVVFPIAAQAQALPTMPVVVADGTILDVVAEGRTTRVPDVATIRSGVVTQASGAAAALRDNAAKMARVLAALRAAGVAERDIQTASVALNPQYRYADNQPPVITGYQASNSVSVRFRDIAKSGAILDALVAQGANQIDGPNLSIDQPDTALDEARADAMKRARARAELYAKASGLGIARIVSISEGSSPPEFAPMPVMMTARRAEAAPTQIAAGERDVTVSVSVRYLLK